MPLTILTPTDIVALASQGESLVALAQVAEVDLAPVPKGSTLAQRPAATTASLPISVTPAQRRNVFAKARLHVVSYPKNVCITILEITKEKREGKEYPKKAKLSNPLEKLIHKYTRMSKRNPTDEMISAVTRVIHKHTPCITRQVPNLMLSVHFLHTGSSGT